MNNDIINLNEIKSFLLSKNEWDIKNKGLEMIIVYFKFFRIILIIMKKMI